MAIKKVAIIGAGPAGAITVDALVQEQKFDVIRVFERREDAGGCWLQDQPDHIQRLPDLHGLAARTADRPLTPPSHMPSTISTSDQYRYSDTSVYPHLETNIDAAAMSFSAEPLPETRSAWSISQHGVDSPFRPWGVVKNYISSLLERNNYQNLVSYNTTVELVQKDTTSGNWILTLRKHLNGQSLDHWWTETFDAVVVASGHYCVPYIPEIPGLSEYAASNPGVVTHSKSFRSPEAYANKRVIVVGASISGPDISSAIAGIVAPPLIAVVRGKYHPYFSDYAFQHPKIARKHGISRFEVSESGRGGTIFFEDGTSMCDVDQIIFGTGYSWTLPFLPNVPVKNNRLPGLFQHIFWRQDPTLLFVGAVAAGFTFKIFEWQAVYAARFLAGRTTLPSLLEMEEWEKARVEKKGDGVPFTALYPDFEEYFEKVRKLAGEPTMLDGVQVGRRLPKFEKKWQEDFDAAHLRRIEMWKRINSEAELELNKAKTTDDIALHQQESRL